MTKASVIPCTWSLRSRVMAVASASKVFLRACALTVRDGAVVRGLREM